jgi:hypothetical protein
LDNYTFVVGQNYIFPNVSGTSVNTNGYTLTPKIDTFTIKTTDIKNYYIKLLDVNYYNYIVGAPTVDLELYSQLLVPPSNTTAPSNTITNTTTTPTTTVVTTTVPTTIFTTIPATTTVPPTQQALPGNLPPWLYIIIIIVVAGAIVGTAILIAKKRHRKR